MAGDESLFFDLLEHINEGSVTAVTPRAEERVFGDPAASLSVRLLIHDRRCYQRILRGGALGLGESYMDGWWDVEGDRLTDFIGILLKNSLRESAKESLLLKVRLGLHAFYANARFSAARKRAIAHHYDLGNEFFKLFLDRSMTYSCGYQLKSTDTLEQMQEQKYALISRKLGLEQGGRLIDIGCGWGGMLLYSASRHDNIMGTGITLSREQYDLGLERVREQNLSDRTRIELRDYQQMQGEYDFLVSVGMFEHVGRGSYRSFMQKMYELLKPGGIGLLHTMGCTEPLENQEDPWFQKYIFPGSYIPRLQELTRYMQKADLLIGHIENLKPHYAITLRKWKENFDRNRDRAKALSDRFDERFLRMWNYYLQACEAGFRYGSMQLYQLLFCKGQEWRFPLCFPGSRF